MNVRKPNKHALIAASLTELQRAYLLTAYDIDKANEQGFTGLAAARYARVPASVWRWIEYGPVGGRHTILDYGPLRNELDRKKIAVNSGTGKVWSTLADKNLLETKYESVPLGRRYGRPMVSLFVRLTTDGRKVARSLLGEPLSKPKQENKPLSLSALRLIEYGQKHPGEDFYWNAPWDDSESGFVADYLMMLVVAKSLIKRGLLTGTAPHQLRITNSGLALDLKKEPNWKPLKTGRMVHGQDHN